nr:hypothetical protein [Ferroplasma acidarmanus]
MYLPVLVVNNALESLWYLYFSMYSSTSDVSFPGNGTVLSFSPFSDLMYSVEFL